MKGLLRWEFRKLIINQKLIWLIFATLLVQVLIGLLSKPRLYVTYNLEIYKELTAEYGGVYREEVKEEIRLKLEEYAIKKEEYQGIVTGYEMYGMGIQEEYESACFYLTEINIYESALRALLAKTDYLDSVKEHSPVLTYDLELSDYLERFEINLVSNVFCLLFSVLLFFESSISGMDQLLTPSVTGRKRIRLAKWVIAMVLCVLATSLFYLLGFLFAVTRWNFCSLDIPAVSLEYFKQWPKNLSILEALGVLFLYRQLQSLAAVALVGIWSRFSKNIIGAAVLFGVVTVIMYGIL